MTGHVEEQMPVLAPEGFLTLSQGLPLLSVRLWQESPRTALEGRESPRKERLKKVGWGEGTEGDSEAPLAPAVGGQGVAAMKEGLPEDMDSA